jgi:hypothetical protein
MADATCDVWLNGIRSALLLATRRRIALIKPAYDVSKFRNCRVYENSMRGFALHGLTSIASFQSPRKPVHHVGTPHPPRGCPPQFCQRARTIVIELSRSQRGKVVRRVDPKNMANVAA